jgi:hypothetical protein
VDHKTTSPVHSLEIKLPQPKNRTALAETALVKVNLKVASGHEEMKQNKRLFLTYLTRIQSNDR